MCLKDAFGYLNGGYLNDGYLNGCWLLGWLLGWLLEWLLVTSLSIQEILGQIIFFTC